jgi:hypothetical protein
MKQKETGGTYLDNQDRQYPFSGIRIENKGQIKAM